MAFQFNGEEVTQIIYNNQYVTELQLDGVTVWTGAPPQVEIISEFPLDAPIDPSIGDIWFDQAENTPKWWNGTDWKGGY